ncbi:hypothetical protein EV702DRAFT_177377 [Suillus placidus]|uniref:TERF2-interacting telomeric protein 1 Myb domain-containing protein n=1 Tax=Suillus placidus TaxID=48579 RepID=A0A9P6ZX02_9AGAM|nr:hypothetical protein EV702DRAFT_177377 [Suillus placidus]
MSRVPVNSVRMGFTADEDTLLMKYIATYNPAKKYRSGNVLYKRLEENVDNKWNWSKTHSWQSWQNRYRKNMEEFDRKILKYQKKKGINPEKQSGKEPQFLPSDEEGAARDRSKATSKGKKRAGGQDNSEQRKVKRAKLETDQPDAGTSRSPLIKTNGTRQIPAVGPSDQARSSHPYQGLSETVSDVPPPSPKPASTFNIPSLPSRSDTLPVLSSQFNSPVRSLPPISSQLPPSSQPLASSSQQVVTPKPPSGPKRVLKHKPASLIFGSPSPTPDRSTPLKTKILPKFVDGHFTAALADRLGRVRPGGCSEEKQTMVWPPTRGKKGKEKEVTQGPTALTSSTAQERERHPVNGVESQTTRPAVVPPKCEPESQRPLAPLPPHPPCNRNGADAAESPLKHRSTNGVGHLVKSLWGRTRDNVMGPASLMAQPAAGPSKLTTAAVLSGLTSSAEPPHGQPVVMPSAPPTSEENVRLPIARSLAQNSTGSASSTTATVQQTRVPSKEEFAPISDAYSIILPQERNSHLIASAPRRLNMQPLPTPGSPFLPSNTDKGKGKGKKRDTETPVTHAQRLLNRTQKRHRRKTVGDYDLPRMDFRTLSAVSTSRIPRSRGSSSASHLPHRYSLPVHSTPSAIPADLSGYLITPGSAIEPVPLALITPVDLPLSASVGFRSLISRIAAAHGYSPDVVLEVYKRVESLEETEKCVRGMRNASESWIEAALEQREREARRARRASNDRDSSESDDSDDEAPRSSRHRPSLQQALPEQRLPNGLRVRHEPGLYEMEYEPLPTKQATLKKRASMGGGGSMGASWRAGAVGHYRTNQAEVGVAEAVVDSSQGGDDEAASGEEAEDSSDDVEQAEEESVVEKLISESPSEDLQDQDDPEYDAKNEPELASDDAEQREEDDRHHEFSLQEHPRAIRIKRESLPPPSLYRPHVDSAQNGEVVLDGALSNVRRTRSVSPPSNADEGIAPLSGDGQMHQMLERRLGKQGMRKRVAQLLR